MNDISASSDDTQKYPKIPIPDIKCYGGTQLDTHLDIHLGYELSYESMLNPKTIHDNDHDCFFT